MKKFNMAAVNTASGPGKGGMFRAGTPAGGMSKRRMQAGGMVDPESEMMDRMGRGMAKAEMQEMAKPRMQNGGIAKAIKKHEASSVAHKAGLKAGGMAKKGVTRADGVIKKAHTKGTMIKMSEGGMAMVMKDGKKVPSFAADGKGKMAYGGKVKMRQGGKC